MKSKIINILKIIGKYIITFVILISSYFALLSVTSMIPSKVIENNVRKSSEILEKKGEKVIFDLGYKEEILFTFTDALMINTAYSIDSNHSVQSFIYAKKNYIPGQTKYFFGDSKYSLVASPKYMGDLNEIYPTKELYGLMHEDNIEDSYEYARYWHGYLIFLRPLLTVFDYGTICIILSVITIISIIIMTILIYKKINLKSAIIYLIGLCSINIFIVSQSINEISIFLIAIISTIILLLRNEKIKNIGIFFFVVGSISSFIDLFTAPLVSLGLPIITYFLLQKEEKPKIKRYIIQILKISFAWLTGYAITWVAKWVISELFFNRALISQAMTQIYFRSRNLKESAITVIAKSLTYISKPVTFVILGICIIFMAVTGYMSSKEKPDYNKNCVRCIPYIIILFFPIIWFAVVKQHSMVHTFFTYRSLVISIICMLIISSKLFERDNNKKEERKEEKIK